ncbi:MAG: phosphotyrosine protein phosphatase [Luteimonas sp.]
MTRHLLCACTRNRLRSPAVAQVFADWPVVETASAGLRADAEVRGTPERRARADTVSVRERVHRTCLGGRFRAHRRHVRVVCLDIPDDFGCMAPARVRLVAAKVTPHLRR